MRPTVLLYVLAALLTLAVRPAVQEPLPPGLYPASIAPLSETEVVLLHETVQMDVLTSDFTTSLGQVSTRTGAAVSAEFVLENSGRADAEVRMGFPLALPVAGGAGAYVGTERLQVFAAGESLPVELSSIDGTLWASWSATLAPGETLVRASYDLPASISGVIAELAYDTATGEAWRAGDGSFRLTLRFPYDVSPAFMLESGPYFGTMTAGAQTDGNTLEWAALPPVETARLAMVFISPDAWLPVQRAVDVVAADALPQNEWQLASAYAALLGPEGGVHSTALAQAAADAYERALSSDPDNTALAQDYVAFLLGRGGALLPPERLAAQAPLLTRVAPPTATATAVPPTVTPSETPTRAVTATPGVTPVATATVATPIPSVTPNANLVALQALANSNDARYLAVISVLLLVFLALMARRYRPRM